MAAEIKKKYGVDAELVKGKGGAFEVSQDGKLLFSKKKEHRFPEAAEVFDKVSAAP